MQLRDGDVSGEIRASLCGSSVPANFATSQNMLLVHFRADDFSHKGGFNFTWTFVEAGNCGIMNPVVPTKKLLLRQCIFLHNSILRRMVDAPVPAEKRRRGRHIPGG